MVPLATMHEALQAVVMKPLQERLLAIHWTLDDIKELLNNQAVETQDLKMLAEKEEKGPTEEMVDTMGAQLRGCVSGVGGPNQGGGRHPS